MKNVARSLCALSFVVACGGAVDPPAGPTETAGTAATSASPKAAEIGAPTGAEKVLEVETAVDVVEGARTSVPAGWKLTPLRDGFRARDPEGELTITMLVLADRDAKHARETLLGYTGRTMPPGSDESEDTDVAGWDQIYEVSHAGGGADPTVSVVNARRKGERVVATLLEGKPGAFNRRNAQVRTIVFGLKMQGVEDEDLSKNEMRLIEGDRKTELEAAMDRALTMTGAPAVAVAVVQKGKIVFARATGTKRVGKSEPVDLSTRFMIGSVSKSLSTLLIARLVDENKLAWSTKVKELLPGFETGDPALTDRLTIADTFCACTGMPRKDLELVFEFAARRPEEAFGVFKGVKPTTAFGETFQYSNQMTALGGFLAARLGAKGEVGKAYAGAMQRLVFEPLGMRSTTADFDTGARSSARPHASSLLDDVGHTAELPMQMERFVTPYAPAGAIFSTVEDMARYALFELARGVTPDGKRVVSEENLLERRKPRTKASAQTTYGLGLAVSKRKGLTTVSHDGGTFGFTTRFLLVPDRDAGLIVMTNASDGAVLELVTGRFFEIAFGEKPRAVESIQKDLRETQARLEKTRREDLGPVPAEVTARLAGTYASDRLGSVSIVRGKNEGRPTLDVGEWKSALGYKKDAGAEKIVLVDAPVGGLGLRIDGADLVLDFQQSSYRLVRKN